MIDVISEIREFLHKKSILILGFGREGKSTYEFIKKYVDYSSLAVADKNRPECDEIIYYGDNYLKAVCDYDVVIKSPGIPFFDIPSNVLVTSQTDMMLRFNRNNMIGITGTKGKSTTSSLIYYILKNAGKNVRFVGNIGIPMFDCLDEILNDTMLICEMSSHQLENVKFSPRIAVLLNIFEEHLDHYTSYEEYQLAKVNIFRNQEKDDIVIYSNENKLVCEYINKYAVSKKFSFPYEYSIESNLIGEHNKRNIMAARLVALYLGVEESIISDSIREFKGLPHRLEFIGEYNNIKYYNDSISTIPEATIMALNALNDVDTVIIGGMDRGVHYDELVNYLTQSKVNNIILMYETGERLFNMLKRSGVKYVKDLELAVNLAKEVTEKNKICLLSPAAASYGDFKNFEERGNIFCELVKQN